MPDFHHQGSLRAQIFKILTSLWPDSRHQDSVQVFQFSVFCKISSPQSGSDFQEPLRSSGELGGVEFFREIRSTSFLILPGRISEENGGLSLSH